MIKVNNPQELPLVVPVKFERGLSNNGWTKCLPMQIDPKKLILLAMIAGNNCFQDEEEKWKIMFNLCLLMSVTNDYKEHEPQSFCYVPRSIELFGTY